MASAQSQISEPFAPQMQPQRRFASESIPCVAPPQLHCTLNSLDIGWQSLLLVRKDFSPRGLSYESLPTPDQQLIAITKGESEIESLRNGRWIKGHKHAGECATAGPMAVTRARWGASAERIESLHLCIPQSYFAEAAEEYRRAGSRTARMQPEFLSFDDPALFQVVTSLANAVSLGYPDTYADGAARFLATHLLSVVSRWPQEIRNIGDDLTDRRLMRVFEYLEHHHLDAVSTQDLARVAGISPFHFARLFKRRTGCTPHQYLVRLRMRSAQSMLRLSDRSILQIAATCGYTNASHFAAAFSKYCGTSPAAYRQQQGRHPVRLSSWAE